MVKRKSDMPTVLFFSPYFYPYTSGITTYPLHLFTNLQKDIHIEVLTFPHKNGLSKKENLEDIHITRMPFLFKITKGFISPQSIFYFWKKVQTADVVILNIPNVEGVPLAILAKLYQKPIIAIYHCEIFHNAGLLSKLLTWIVRMCVNFQLYLATKIVGYTEEYLEMTGVMQKYKQKVEIVLPPIPPLLINQELYKNYKKEKKETIWIGYAGRVAQEKGLEVLIDAIAQLQLPSFNSVELILTGPFGKDVAGEEDYYNEIRQQLEDNNIKHRFLGYQKKEDLGAFYKSIDLLALPSTNSTEAFGMVQAEAMLAGTPVIASDLVGVRAPINMTKMGLIVEPRNSKQLADAIAEIVTNPGKYSNSQTQSIAKKIFTINKTSAFYRHLITSLSTL